MRAKSLTICFLVFLTAFVLVVALRIEYLNSLAGHVLPRHTHDRVDQFNTGGIAKFEVVMERLDQQFFDRREEVARMESSNELLEKVPVVPVYGAPYSPTELRSIDNVKYQHGILTQLLWYLGNLGMVQHFLAPATFLFAIVCGLGFSGGSIKTIAGVCGTLSCVAIFSFIFLMGIWRPSTHSTLRPRSRRFCSPSSAGYRRTKRIEIRLHSKVGFPC